MKSKVFLILILTLCIMMLFVTSSVAEAKMGGVLKVVLDADPPTLVPHASSTTLVFVVGYHMFEGLYSLDENLNTIPIPFLSFLWKRYSSIFLHQRTILFCTIRV